MKNYSRKKTVVPVKHPDGFTLNLIPISGPESLAYLDDANTQELWTGPQGEILYNPKTGEPLTRPKRQATITMAKFASDHVKSFEELNFTDENDEPYAGDDREAIEFLCTDYIGDKTVEVEVEVDGKKVKEPKVVPELLFLWVLDALGRIGASRREAERKNS